MVVAIVVIEVTVATAVIGATEAEALLKTFFADRRDGTGPSSDPD